MAIPTSKPLSLSTVQTEYGGSNPISMSEYRGKGNAPATGPIDLWGDFNGTSNAASIEIRVYGAKGGYTNGGGGGYTQFKADVVPGTTFNLYAGGAGEDGSFYVGASGGSCSYVTSGSTLIAIAGGGGGAGATNNFIGGSGGGSNNAGGSASSGSAGGSNGNGGAADNTNARYNGQDGYSWTDSGSPGKGGYGSGSFLAAAGGENPGNKGEGGYGGSGEDFSDQGGGGGGGGYGGGGGGCISEDNGAGEAGGGGGGFRLTSSVTGITVTGGGGSNGANAGHGYIQVYNGGSLVTTITATSRTGASGTYTVPS